MWHKTEADKHQPYNHDMHIPEYIVDQHEKLAGVLNIAPLLSLFDAYDEAAKRLKAKSMRLGVVALALGVLALLGVLAEVGAPALGKQIDIWTVIIIESSALLSLLIFYYGRTQRFHSHYLDACYARERLRHLHFQLFLNGPLVEKIVSGQVSVDEAIKPFLADFNLDTRNLPGVRSAYLGRVPIAQKLLVKVAAYTESNVAKEVYELLVNLRFEHQIQYTKRRLEPLPIDRPLSLKEHFEWSEAAGKWSLFAALMIPVVQLAIIMGNGGTIEIGTETIHLWLSILAIGMAVLGVGVRAYQRGMGVPEEIESYESYASHVESLLDQFIVAKHSGQTDTLHYLLQEMELEAERELRRFLAIKSRTTFLL